LQLLLSLHNYIPRFAQHEDGRPRL
jgi:hypothetical protein